MEDFEKIKEISLEEAKAILPKNLAYLTMKNGDIVIINGLDHHKFDQREKDYEDWFEEQSKMSKMKTGPKNLQASLIKIQEDSEENERNSILQDRNINKNNNIQYNLNSNIYKNEPPLKNNYSLVKSNNFNIQPRQLFYYNNNSNLLYNNQNYQRINDNNYYTGINYVNAPINRYPSQNYNIEEIKNYNNFKKYRSNVNQGNIVNNMLRQNNPIMRNYNFQMIKNVGKKGINKYIRYNNHNYMEVKE